VAEWRRDTPWRQGHLLTDEAVAALRLGRSDGTSRTLVAIATHDCDLTQPIEKEPAIEVVIGRVVEESNGICLDAKNPRKLHLHYSGNAPCIVEFEATAKVSIGKMALADFTPCSMTFLDPKNYNIYQFWLGSRYRRSAFPDEFERRLKDETKLAKKIANILEPLGAQISGVFFDVDGGNEVSRDGPDDTYTLDILILHSAEPDFMAAEAAAIKASDAIKAAFTGKLFTPTRTWKQIELSSCDPVSESVLTYDVFKRLKRWPLEHISLGDDPPKPVLAE
jgi:hypothetical protein